MEDDKYREALERQGRSGDENTLAQTVGAGNVANAGAYEFDGDASALERDESEVPTIIESVEGVRDEP